MLSHRYQNAQQWIFLLLLVSSSGKFNFSCPCKNQADCSYPEKDLGASTEVFAFSNGTTKVEPWTWDSVTTLVVPAGFKLENEAQANTMCIAHSKGRKFSITAPMTLQRPLNASSEDAAKWVRTMCQQVRTWHADILTVDLLRYFAFNLDSTGADLMALAQILVQVKQEMGELTKIPFKMACIVPWKPPCAKDNESCDFAHLSNDACDYYVIHPDSFTDHDNIRCIARATIPMSKLLYGLSEYNVHHVPPAKMILGVPWHGYSYECGKLLKDVCYLPKKQGEETCDFSRRNPISYKSIVRDHESISNAHKAWFDAPHYSITRNAKQLQIWYEDKDSLTAKYKLVHEMGLKGVALMYGDDLATGLTAQDIISDALMWSFVAHEFLITSTKKPHAVHHDLHYADNMAGVAVGCLLLGTALGSILTCLALRSRIRRPKRFFMHQADDTTGFIDEDDRHL
ncbi:chitobiase, di-N-acetyl [Elysia marginata]|uniref:Chitobiase, di-N-acetyl n=1 Tax=Elysia marginata TaxID=1093978 RepID=A0AAV4F5Y9_9GAST|nr:chitobiase, di-N-acetyl [Elysia marginata]